MHREALTILKLWGASQRELHAPGMLSGLLVGGLGGAVALVGWLTAGRVLIYIGLAMALGATALYARSGRTQLRELAAQRR